MEFVRVSLVLIFISFTAAYSSRRLLSSWAVDDSGCRIPPNNSVGVCKRISECKPMTDFLLAKDTFTDAEKEAIQSYRCGFYGTEVKVCCPDRPITLEWINPDDKCLTPTKDDGYCIIIKECQSIVDFIESKDSLSDAIAKEIQQYGCGYDRQGNPKVCCPPEIPPHWNQPAEDLLPKTCGLSASTSRIVYGNLTDLFEFPWAVALKYDKQRNQYSCGGSLISDRYVLTAAHCIRSPDKLIGVRLGEHDFRTDIDCIEAVGGSLCAEKPQDFDISVGDAIVHSGYNQTTLVNDIALIRLPRQANISTDSVSPICLPLTPADRARDIGNFTVIGWGATENGTSSKVLLKVTVPKVENKICAPKYEKSIKLTENQLCAGGRKSQDSCAGDSGGPLISDITMEDGQVLSYQYGVVSLGPRICGIENFPAVYTRVDKYIEWILANITP